MVEASKVLVRVHDSLALLDRKDDRQRKGTDPAVQESPGSFIGWLLKLESSDLPKD
jgi:hypothetical protein